MFFKLNLPFVHKENNKQFINAPETGKSMASSTMCELDNTAQIFGVMLVIFVFR